MSFLQESFSFNLPCEFSMSCSWAGSQRVTGYSPRYMRYLLPLGWMSSVQRTMCEYCSSSKQPINSISLFCPSVFRNKAVSDGAISFYLDHFVRTRVSKITYGYFCHIPYDPNDPDHRARSHKVFTSVSGNKRISDSFDIILPKVSCVTFFFPYSAYFVPQNICQLFFFFI
jgi:hypothetical protein